MATFGDVMTLARGTDAAIKIFGASERYMKRHTELLHAIGKALREELGLSPAEVAQLLGDTVLPLLEDTVLPPAAEVRFKEWQAFEDKMHREAMARLARAKKRSSGSKRR